MASNEAEQIRDTRKRIADLGTKYGQTFEYCDRLAELMRRQAEIADALDLKAATRFLVANKGVGCFNSRHKFLMTRPVPRLDFEWRCGMAYVLV